MRKRCKPGKLRGRCCPGLESWSRLDAEGVLEPLQTVFKCAHSGHVYIFEVVRVTGTVIAVLAHRLTKLAVEEREPVDQQDGAADLERYGCRLCRCRLE